MGYNRRVRAPSPSSIRALALVCGAVAAAFVLVYPFTVARYPAITDLPFHAAQVSIFRHYGDPAFHFTEQFELHPFDVPYVSMYFVGTCLAYVLPIHVAAKAMAVAMLALLPLGLGLLFHGLKKNPLLGLLGLGFAYSDLTHWGFLNFVGALGLYAASIGAALLLLDRPSGKRELGLGALLVLLFFTHVYRFPYAILAILLTALVMYPATRRVKPLLRPMGAACALFVTWFALRPATLSSGLGPLQFDATRWQRAGEFVFGSYLGASGVEEKNIAKLLLGALAVVVAISLIFHEEAPGSPDSRWFSRARTLLPLALGAGHLLAYFTLPSRVGEWWYVYPRELPAALFIAVAAVPDLPRRRPVELGAVLVTGLAAGRMALFVASRWLAFEQATADFRQIAGNLPPAPKLAYLVIDHSLPAPAGDKRWSPMVHLPAWIQAERGGSLSFHFAGWRIFPVWYRPPSVSVPPPVPRDFEWNPSWFQVNDQGRFFDWFLVRLHDDPAPIFAPDPSIQLVDHQGSFWLYRRR